jgi:tRNA(Ile)-lysidine synthase
MTAASDFLTNLRRGLRRCELSNAGVLVGVSGGADSVALLRGLLELRNEFALTLHVAHLNHQLRDTASDADALWVGQLCRAVRVPAEIGVAGPIRSSSRGGVEEAAREARHRFLDQVAADIGCDAIVTAHTADDQAETVLHHLFRGTGLSGLRGIPLVRTTTTGRRLVRPMLAIRRASVEGYLAEIGQDFRSDATNADTSLTRNWLRHKLLPDLRGQFGSRVDISLTRLAEQAAEIEETLASLAERMLNLALLDRQPGVVRLNTRVLANQPLHLVREVLRLVWQRQKWPLQSMGFAEWNRLAEVVLFGGDTNLPGAVRVRHENPGLAVLEKTGQQSTVHS